MAVLNPHPGPLPGRPTRRRRRAVAENGARAVAAALAVLSAGCAGGQPPPPLRSEPIAYSDTLPIREPASREPLEATYLVPDAVSGEVARGISLRRAFGQNHEALNVTRYDDVVSSAWFEHRNARRRLTPDQVYRGPTTEGPDTTGSLTLIAAKMQGISPGFTIRDGRGDRYVVKFDPKGFLFLSSAAGVISNRLFHAAGFHVPEDFVFRFRSDQLRVEPEAEATYVDEAFVERPLTLEVAEEVLQLTDTLPDGRYLAVASKYVPGPPKGPFHFEGRRQDDPNDHYRHEHRRELRGLYVVSSWLNHVDMRFMNTMDAYVEPGYLRHYLIDFAATLGSGTIRPHQPREGSEYNFDFWPTLARVSTLGFYRQGWEGRDAQVIEPSIGWLQVEEFDPATWKANWPNAAFRNMTARDSYWGAKLVGSFTDEQIRAAVAAGELPTRTAADTLARILIYRRDRIVEHWYARVSPVEHVRTGAGPRRAGEDPAPGFELSFEDYGVRDGAWSAEEVVYEWEFNHAALDRTWTGTAGARRGTFRQRLTIVPGPGESPGRASHLWPAGDDAIAVLRLRTVRQADETRARPATVYLRLVEGEPGYQVIGLEH